MAALNDGIATLARSGGVSDAKYYSPYFDVTLPGDSLGTITKLSGVKDVTLAFMQGLKSQIDGTGADAWLKPGVKPVVGWGGYDDADIPVSAIVKQVHAIGARGGDVTISFGGYTGRDIAVLARQYGDLLDGNRDDAMTKAEMGKAIKHLASQYQKVTTTYGVNHLDFDIENSTISGEDADKYATVNDAAANHIRNLAIKQLQATDPDLRVSYTVATTPDGLHDSAVYSGMVLDIFRQAAKDGVKVDVVNIMAMDYFSDTPNIEMGQTAIKAAKAVHAQLAGIGLGDVKIGITPMLGLNDYWNVANDKKEIFTLQDAREVLAFVQKTPWAAGVGAWQLTRDRAHSVDTTENNAVDPETGNQYAGPDPYHTDIVQKEWEFSKIFANVSKRATNGNDILAGGSEANVFKGLAGNDRIYGGAGNDRIYGGKGADKLYGGDGEKGIGKDTFVFTKLSDSTVSTKGQDTIYDFTNGDRFDLSAIDASTKAKGDQAFAWIGTDMFSGHAGELRLGKLKSDTYVHADTNGDKKADFAFHLDDAVKLVKADFLL